MFREFLVVLRRYRWSVLLAVVNVFALTVVLTLTATPMYHAEAAVLVVPLPAQPSGTPENLNILTEAELIQSNVIARRVIEAQGLAIGADALASRVDVNPIQDTNILTIGFTAESPKAARDRVQGFVEAYLGYRTEQANNAASRTRESIQAELDALEQRLAEVAAQLATAAPSDAAQLQSQLNVISTRILERQLQLTDAQATPSVGTVLREATADPDPVSPNPIRNAMIGLVAGLLLGLATAAVRDQLDDRIHDVPTLLTVLGTHLGVGIPRHRRFRREPLQIQASGFGLEEEAVDAYRALAIEVTTTMVRRGARSLLVTGAESGAGASTVAATLAQMLARTGRRVVLVSADVRDPVVETWFGVQRATGLADVLAGSASVSSALIPTRLPGLELVPPGSESLRVPEMLASTAMASVVDELAGNHDFVILDSAPIGDRSDALWASQAVHHVLLVASSGTHDARVAHAQRQVLQVGAEVVGGVLTHMDRPSFARLSR